jgi:hypothetical protein
MCLFGTRAPQEPVLLFVLPNKYPESDGKNSAGQAPTDKKALFWRPQRGGTIPSPPSLFVSQRATEGQFLTLSLRNVKL